MAANVSLGSNPVEATVLLVIGANPGVIQSEVGRLLGIASVNMALLVARLADRELIERDAVDGRSQGLKLSDAGRRRSLRSKAAAAKAVSASLPTTRTV